MQPDLYNLQLFHAERSHSYKFYGKDFTKRCLDIHISDEQLIYLARKLHRMKSNTHKQIKIRSLKIYAIKSLNQHLRMIRLPDWHFHNVTIAYSDFIQRITRVINKIALFKEIRIKNCSEDWFDGEFLDKIILKR